MKRKLCDLLSESNEEVSSKKFFYAFIINYFYFCEESKSLAPAESYQLTEIKHIVNKYLRKHEMYEAICEISDSRPYDLEQNIDSLVQHGQALIELGKGIPNDTTKISEGIKILK